MPDFASQAAPMFARLAIDDKHTLESLTSKDEPYSDFNFTSLYCWDIDASTEVSCYQSNIIISMPDYVTGRRTFSVLGHNNVDETLEKVFELTDVLEFVPESVVASIRHPEHFEIIEDRDNFDYLYDLSVLTSLAGQKYKKKRNKINHVSSAYGDRLSVVTTRGVGLLLQQEVQQLFDEWAVEAGKSSEDVAVEQKALRRALSVASQLGLLLTVVRLDSKMRGFSLNEPLGDYAICHFEKALDADMGTSSYVAYEAAKELHRLGCRWVNWEQDLGIAGLRQAKLAWQPDGYLKKYKLRKAMLYSKVKHERNTAEDYLVYSGNTRRSHSRADSISQ